MKVQALHIGMQVKHPQYGLGTVKALNEHTAEIQFNDGRRSLEPHSSGVEPAEAQASVQGLEMPLSQFVQETVERTVAALGLEKPESKVRELGKKWHHGMMTLKPHDPSLQSKELPLEVFFHKIVMLRNNLRVLEQKINAHQGLTDGEKFDMQQYITRSYGSLTTFNVLFQNKEDQFRSKN